MEINLNPESWTNWLISKGLSETTITEYNRYISKLIPITLTQDYFLEFIKKKNNQMTRAAIRNLLNYIITSDLYSDDIKTRARYIDIPKMTGRKKKRIINVLSESEVFEVAKAMTNERNKIMILITFYAGLRISELVGIYAIKPYSFNWQQWLKDPDSNGDLKVTGKGNKQRMTFIPALLMARIYKYIKNEISEKQSKDDPLFEISDRRWQQILSKAAYRVFGRQIYPHLIRHSTSMWLKSLKWDVEERKLYLGHEDVRTTIFYDHTDTADIKEKFSSTVKSSITHLNYDYQDQEIVH